MRAGTPVSPGPIAGPWRFVPVRQGTQTLEMDNNQGFSVTPDRMSIWLGGKRDGIRLPLRRPLPANAEVRAFRLVEKRRGRMGVRNRKLASVEYEVHLSVLYADPAPVVSPETLLDIVGVRIRNHWATSDGAIYRNNGRYACDCPPPRPREDGRPGRFRHSGRCGLARPRHLQERIVKKYGGSARRRVSRRRLKLERRRRELLRMRTADRNRVFTAHAQDLLDRRQHPVRMVAVESVHRRGMMSTARGGTGAPGGNVREKREFNRRLAEAATGETMAILAREAEKRGIPVVEVSPRDSFRTCSKCGDISDGSRKSQARFECTGLRVARQCRSQRQCGARFQGLPAAGRPGGGPGTAVRRGAGTALLVASVPALGAGLPGRRRRMQPRTLRREA